MTTADHRRTHAAILATPGHPVERDAQQRAWCYVVGTAGRDEHLRRLELRAEALRRRLREGPPPSVYVDVRGRLTTVEAVIAAVEAP